MVVLTCLAPVLPLLTSRHPSEYISAIYELSTLVVKREHRMLHHWDWLYWRTAEGRRFRRACAVVHEFTASIVQKRRAQLHLQGEPEKQGDGFNMNKVTDFIDVLLLSKVCARQCVCACMCICESV